MKKIILIAFIGFISFPIFSQESYSVKYVSIDSAFTEKPDPSSKVWENATPMQVTLLPQTIAQPSLLEGTVPSLSFKSVHNNESIFVLLEWADSGIDQSLETEKMSDACAIQFPVKDPKKTSPFMGAKDFPVGIGMWKAVWQSDVEKGFARIKDIYPNTWTDSEKFGQNTALLSKNQVSNDQRKTPAQFAIAEGFGSLALQPDDVVKAWGIWNNGKWKVAFSMKLNSGKLKLEPGKDSAIGFAVWEGAKGNVGARKNYAAWQPISIAANK